MKKFFAAAASLAVCWGLLAGMTACGLGERPSSAVSFVVDGAMLSQLQARTAVADRTAAAQYTMYVALRGGYTSDAQTVTITNQTQTVRFDEIPVGNTVYAVAIINYTDGTETGLAYYGISGSVKISAGDNPIALSLNDAEKQPDVLSDSFVGYAKDYEDAIFMLGFYTTEDEDTTGYWGIETDDDKELVSMGTFSRQNDAVLMTEFAYRQDDGTFALASARTQSISLADDEFSITSDKGVTVTFTNADASNAQYLKYAYFPKGYSEDNLAAWYVSPSYETKDGSFQVKILALYLFTDGTLVETKHKLKYVLGSGTPEEEKEVEMIARYTKTGSVTNGSGTADVDGTSYAFTITNGRLKITDIEDTYIYVYEKPSAYGVQTDYTPNTKIVLYNYDAETGYQYYLRDSADASVLGDGDFTSDAPDTAPNNFCFDSDGNFYVLKASSEDSPFKVCSDKTGFTDVLISDSPDNAPCITVDLATNILYASSNNGVSWTMNKYPNLVSSSGKDSSSELYFYYPSESEWLFNASEPFVVYDGIVYAVCSKYNSETSSNEYKLAVFDTTKSSRSATSDGGATQYTVETQSNDIVDIEWSDFAASSSAKITDMLYQDGAVYMLVRDYYTSELLFGANTSEASKFYSRGAVLKYDVSTKAVKTLGWTSSAVDTSTASLYGYITDSSQNVCYVYNDESMSSPFKITKDMEGLTEAIKSILFPVIYAPQTTDKGFYGPQKFIAIKPKKLIIADDGLTFYTDNDLWNYKNANRIVTVDLESFAITSIQEGTVSFDEDFTESMITGDASYPAIASSYFNGENKKYAAYAKETDNNTSSEISRDVYAAMKLSE